MKKPSSHGTGRFKPDQFKHLGKNVVFEEGVLVFHPETISIGDNVYVGHQAMLKGYYNSQMSIGAGTWIGQQCFFHSGGGLHIGQNVGVGPGVKIITSTHEEAGWRVPILHSPLAFSPVEIGDDCDLGVGSIVLPGVTLGKGVLVGAGAVVTQAFPDIAVIAGVPAKLIRYRDG